MVRACTHKVSQRAQRQHGRLYCTFFFGGTGVQVHGLVAVRVATVSAVLVRVSIMRMGLRILLVRACAAAQPGHPPLQQLLMPGEVLAQWSTMAWGAVLQATCPLPERRQALTLHASCTQGEMTLHCFSCVLNKTVQVPAQSSAVYTSAVGGTRGR